MLPCRLVSGVPLSPRPIIALGLLLGCAADKTGADPGEHTAAVDSAEPDPARPHDTHDTSDTADSADTGTSPTPAPYCRSLDPDWAAAYTEPIDAELAVLIDERGLLGDPTLYIDDDGHCRRRSLPDIADPLPQLGRTLFFSPELSGDRDVACATCHHPALGGADALVLPLGVGFPSTTVGEDRPDGITDVDQLQLPRNSPSVLNVGLWDHRLMWDGRVEADDPTAGFNGSAGGIRTPDGPATAPDLPSAQALMPIGHPHEMAGSLSASSVPVVDAVVARLSENEDWQAAFASACTQADALPTSWADACEDPELPMVQAEHLAVALGAYQRSLLFVDTPWAAYVQGDIDAIPDAVKQGAMVFLRTTAEGGLNCASCHAGDFFTDEELHAIGAPQIGPGNPLGTGTAGLDRGRAEHTGSDADNYAYRTPTLLNVSTTAPYFHSGTQPDLFRTVLHYRGVEESIEQTFGAPGEPPRHPPVWCTTSEFSGIEDCDRLYTAEATHGGDLSTGIDGEVEGIDGIRGTSTDLVVLFLESLTDPRLLDPAALSPWVDDRPSVPTPTERSDPWPDRCQQMLEWPQALDLRVKGARWLFKGGRLTGTDESTGLDADTLFGRQYWEVFGSRYSLLTGLSEAPVSVSVGVLALLSEEELDSLLAAYPASALSAQHTAWLQRRAEVAQLIDRWRDSHSTVDLTVLVDALREVHASESAIHAALADAYGSAWGALGDDDRTQRTEALRRYFSGDLSDLPSDTVDPTRPYLLPSDAMNARLDDLGLDWDDDLATYVLGYGTWTAGPDCVGAFTQRQDFDGRAAAYFGFSPWVDRRFFNLQTGVREPLTPQEELAGLVEQMEQAAGYEGIDQALVSTNTTKRAWLDAVDGAARAARTLGEAVAAGGDTSTASDALGVSHDTLAEAEADLLAAELGWYFDLRDALDTDQRTTIADWIDCLESPETQALRGNGGFDAHGGSCLP